MSSTDLTGLIHYAPFPHFPEADHRHGIANGVRRGESAEYGTCRTCGKRYVTAIPFLAGRTIAQRAGDVRALAVEQAHEEALQEAAVRIENAWIAMPAGPAKAVARLADYLAWSEFTEVTAPASGMRRFELRNVRVTIAAGTVGIHAVSPDNAATILWSARLTLSTPAMLVDQAIDCAAKHSLEMPLPEWEQALLNGAAALQSEWAAARARRTYDTTEYEASHGSLPRGRGGWIFREADTGQEYTHAGTYTEARKHAPAGRWIVLP